MTQIASPFRLNTSCKAGVTDAAWEIEGRLSPISAHSFIRVTFTDCEKPFWVNHPGYQASDLPYHDFQHNLQVSATFMDQFVARQNPRESPPFSHRQFERGLTAALYHDSGYLKLRSDREETGARYTFCDVLRNCALAASHLSRRGLKIEELDIVLVAIRCTGPSTTGMNFLFNRTEDNVLASKVATADYLGQMAADDYPDESGLLFQEFAESDAFRFLPTAQRLFNSAANLAGGCTGFWKKVVKPKFDNDFGVFTAFSPGPIGATAHSTK